MDSLKYMTNYRAQPHSVPTKDNLHSQDTLYKVRDIFRDNENTVQVVILRSDGSFMNIWKELS